MPTDACQFFYECTGCGKKLKPKSVIWIIALIWMGKARMLNARSCNRTHCRYTGPYYLAMTVVPVGNLIRLVCEAESRNASVS
jgi:hypothetical protein